MENLTDDFQTLSRKNICHKLPLHSQKWLFFFWQMGRLEMEDLRDLFPNELQKAVHIPRLGSRWIALNP